MSVKSAACTSGRFSVPFRRHNLKQQQSASKYMMCHHNQQPQPETMDYLRMLRDLAAPPCTDQEDEGREVSHVTIVSDHAKTHAPSSRSGSTISSHSGHSTSSKTARLDRWQPAPIPPPPTKDGGTAQCRWESSLGNFRKSSSSSDRQGRPSTAFSLSNGPKLPQRMNSQRKGRDIALSATKKPPYH